MLGWLKNRGKLIADRDQNGVWHFTYWNADDLIYVRDGNYPASQIGPHFLDLGIKGSCTQDCPDCYMKAKRTGTDMPPKQVDDIIWNLRHTLCQVSFGGAGDPADYEALAHLPGLGARRLRQEKEDENEGWPVDLELLGSIARCVTINPRSRAFTKEQVQKLADFTAIGLSCGWQFADEEIANTERLIRQIGELRGRPRPKIVLHVIVGTYPRDPRRLLRLLTYDNVEGLLFLACKRSPCRPHDLGAFFDLDTQRQFWRQVKIVREATDVPIAVDSCLARLVHPSMLKVDRRAMHPCDAGRFSAYVHADGKMWLCSCGAKPVSDWETAIRTPQSCRNVLPPGPGRHKSADFKDPLAHNWPNPYVIIQRGPMTNSSSASYFVIGPPDKFRLRIVDLAERRRKASEEWATCDGAFPWLEYNNRLVRLTPHEWAAWCARDIAASTDPARRKRQLDRYTLRIVSNRENVCYLVANRDDGGIPPFKYEREDVSWDRNVVFFKGD